MFSCICLINNFFNNKHFKLLSFYREAYIGLAVLRLVEEEKCVVEGAGATGLAAALAGKLDHLKGKRLVTIIRRTETKSYGNMEFTEYIRNKNNRKYKRENNTIELQEANKNRFNIELTGGTLSSLTSLLANEWYRQVENINQLNYKKRIKIEI